MGRDFFWPPSWVGIWDFLGYAFLMYELLFDRLGRDFWVGIFSRPPMWVGILGNPYPVGSGFYTEVMISIVKTSSNSPKSFDKRLVPSKPAK